MPGDLIIRTELIQVDDAVEKAYYDFLVPVQVSRLLKKPDEENYRRILVKLGPAADALDLREPYSSQFYRSIEEMERIVKMCIRDRGAGTGMFKADVGFLPEPA